MSNVKDFGAVGDGKVDDTQAIQHAVDRGDGRVVLSRGTFRITRPIVVDLDRTGYVSIHGSGGIARILMEGPGAALHLVGSHDKTADPAGFKGGVWDRQRMPTVSEIEIVGGQPNTDGIRLEGTMQATLTGVAIRRCRFGLHLVKRNRNVLISHCHIYNGREKGIGVYFDGVNLHQTIISGSHISYHVHAGIKVERSEVRNLQITGCDIEYNFDVNNPDSADVWIDSRQGTVREVTIASNTIQAKESPSGANIRIEGADLPASSSAGLWTIAGNILQSQATNLWLRSCRGINVTGNSFATGFRHSIVVDRCRHIVIGSNTIDHNPDYKEDYLDGVVIRDSAGINVANLIVEAVRAGSAEQGGAVEISGSREVTVAGCQILDPAHRGIDLRDVRNTRVSDCTIVDRKTPATMLEALRIRGACSGVQVLNNLVGKGTSGDIDSPDGLAMVGGTMVVAGG